jgi:hypothetical protein
MKRLCLAISLLACCSAGASIFEDPFFHSSDPLAPRDEWGRLHQSAALNDTDYERRYHWRPLYYLESRKRLIADPAYVGALQTALRMHGYYCGDTDGIYSPELSEAIARLQKNYSMRVSGTLTVPVRRTLHLP